MAMNSKKKMMEYKTMKTTMNLNWGVYGLTRDCTTTLMRVLAGVLLIGLIGCDFGEEQAIQCVFDGKAYAVGDLVPVDTCNACGCTADGEIVCTQIACLNTCEFNGQTYMEGDVFDAGDGCNTCSCTSEGVGLCTDMACPEQCPAAKVVESDEICVAMTVHAKNPQTGLCCFYATPCEAPGNWDHFGSLEACQVDDCVQISCPSGMGSKDTNGDGCDDVCVNACTPEACGPQPMLPNYNCPDGKTIAGPTGECTLDENQICGWEIIECPEQCEPGTQKEADDGCNTCACTEGGIWACTDMACPELCPPPKAFEGICVTVEAVAKHPVTGECCHYSTPCVVPDGLEIVTYEECESDECEEDNDCPAGEMCMEGTCMTVIPCETVACAPGYEAQDTDGDGCDDTCFNGCTDADCGPQLGIPNYECPDGKNWAGPTGECKPSESGQCGWEVIECPAQCEAGDQKDAGDGCNTCSCTETGLWICTEMACPCNPQAEWNRQYMSTNPQECTLLDYACPEYTTQFANECGCGCEQDASCPEWFSCMPSPDGNACDEDKIKQCPYSEIAV